MTVLVLFYAMLHVAKIEVFPFYHFGMYSLPKPYKEMPYTSYQVFVDNQAHSFKQTDYRKYTYLKNTLEKYDVIKSNTLHDPNQGIVKKYLHVLGIHSLDQKINSTYHYPNLEQQLKGWLVKYLDVNSDQSISIIKSTYKLDHRNQVIPIDQETILK